MRPEAWGNVVLLILSLLPNAVRAQVDTAWVRRYNGPGNRADYFNDLAVDRSGSVYLTGASWVSGNGLDIVTIKYTPSGDTAWMRTYNGAGDSTDVGYRIALDRWGDVFVSGAGIGNNSKQDYATVKYDSLGTLLWSRIYNGPSSEADVINALALDSSGNAYVTGRSHGGSTGYDYLTIKYKPNGDMAWVRRFTGTASGYDEAFGLGVDGIGNAYVTGRSYGDSTRADYLTLKYSPTGDTLWSRRYDGNLGDDIANALALDAAGNVYATGQSIGAGSNDVLTLSYAPDGTLRWARRYDGPSGGEDEGKDIAVDPWGNMAVAGTAAAANGDALILKHDSLGTQSWARTYNGPGDSSDFAQAVCSDSLDHFYISGRSVGLGTREDFFTAGYDSAGNRLWVQSYDGSGGYDEALAIGLDRAKNVLVAGLSWGETTNWDGVVIKYRTLIGIAELPCAPKPRASKFMVRGLNKGSLQLKYFLSAPGNIKIDLYDVRGGWISEIASGYHSAGEHQEKATLGLPSGAYFLRLSTGGEERFGKAVVLR